MSLAQSVQAVQLSPLGRSPTHTPDTHLPLAQSALDVQASPWLIDPDELAETLELIISVHA